MHRWSKLFIPTLREAPADAEVPSHKLLLRAGYMRQLGAGIYSYLFLGNRSLNKIIAIVRREMDRIGQEMLLPTLHPRELWEESGRWTGMGQNMFRLQDRKGAWLVLGMTHEEAMTSIARNELRSYKQLPQIWYQIQTKFRDEPRPKAGLLRVRQFIMKDSYSFDLDAAGLDESFRKHDAAYRAILTRCGLDFVAVDADSGAMGGSQSQEFAVYSEAGEDLIASCPNCGYAANVEKATSGLTVAEDLAPTADEPVEVATPTEKTIAEVASSLGVSPVQTIKSFLAVATHTGVKEMAETPVVVFLRGDHSVNEAKVLASLARSGAAGAQLRPMQADEIRECFGLEPGFIGPAGLSPAEFPRAGKWRPPQFYFDQALKDRKNLIAGANKVGLHLKNVTPGRDFLVMDHCWVDVRNVNPNEPCPNCAAPLRIGKAIEVGHIFKLGHRYSEAMGARVLDSQGKEVAPIMGSYGLGMERILTAAVEQNHDDNGFWMPRAIAPFDVLVTVTNMANASLAAAAEQVARQLEEAGFDVLLDDRDERAGVKFKDADLIGIPYRVNVGRKASEGRLEVVTRATSISREVAAGEVAARLGEWTRGA